MQAGMTNVESMTEMTLKVMKQEKIIRECEQKESRTELHRTPTSGDLETRKWQWSIKKKKRKNSEIGSNSGRCDVLGPREASASRRREERTTAEDTTGREHEH